MASGIIEAIWTEKGRERVRDSIAHLVLGTTPLGFKYFKIGEGGYVTTAGGRVPNTPDSREMENDIEADGSPGNSFFQKDFVVEDISLNPDGSIRFRVRVDYTEGNDNGFGDDPRYFEIGIFDESDNMVIYGTFPEETKNESKRLTHQFDMYFLSLDLTEIDE